MTILTYKGYQGSVTWEDGVNVIRVLHIGHLLSDHTENAKKVERTFRGLVDDYIETCRRLGREPEKPFKGSFNVRIPPELHRGATMAAAAENLSLNAWIADAVRAKLQQVAIARQLITYQELALESSRVTISGIASQQTGKFRSADYSHVGNWLAHLRGRVGVAEPLMVRATAGSSEPLAARELQWSVDAPTRGKPMFFIPLPQQSGTLP